MPTIKYDDITINVDDEGYLLNREEWDEKVEVRGMRRDGMKVRRSWQCQRFTNRGIPGN